MIDPLFKSLEVLRQVYPGGATILVAPIDYKSGHQWLFVLTDAADTDYTGGFDPGCNYRFFPGTDNTGYAFRSGQEALKFARNDALNFNMERFEQQINSKLARHFKSNEFENELIQSVFPGQDLDDVYNEATKEAVIRKRYAINKLKDYGFDVIAPTNLSVIKDDNNDDSPSNS